MLMVFEGMLCRQRQSSLMMLRNMRRPPVVLMVYRLGKWGQSTSEEIVPGDIVSLCSSGRQHNGRKRASEAEVEDLVLPCDALLIRGSCVVNEAMLTGESVPQIKETLANADTANIPALSNITHASKLRPSINMNFDNNNDTTWRRHVVMGGTTLLQHAGASPDEETRNDLDIDDSLGGVPLPPDKGCTAVVIRTGFATVQGGLMRKILFASERINTDDYEAFYFIAALVVFAVIASGVVLQHGLNDPNRNQFKLILHCIMIVTSVIPPELPMELSLAITNSLASLSKCLVYCTEPFRLPFAGKLDVLCFDKTGTLTKDKMYLKGLIVSPLVQNTPITKLLSPDPPSSSSSSSAGTQRQQAIDQHISIEPVHPASSASELMTAAMAACHSLILKTASNIHSYIGIHLLL